MGVYKLNCEGKASGKHNRVSVCGSINFFLSSLKKIECFGEIFIRRELPAPLASQIDILKMREIDLFSTLQDGEHRELLFSNPSCVCVCPRSKTTSHPLMILS